jgi:CubicO group peptidase (beta-lactamase class C family)
LVPISAVDEDADFYGFMWYTKAESIGRRSVIVHFASGNGGNKIYVVPSLDMVIAVTSSAYNRPYRHSQSRNILQRILAATRP